MEALTELELAGLGITDLSGLEMAVNLNMLDIRGNDFADPAAVWAVLDQLPLWVLRTDVARPGGHPEGLATERVTALDGNPFFISVDVANLTTLDISGSSVDLSDAENVRALKRFEAAGVELDAGEFNRPPALSAEFTVLDEAAGQVELDGSGSADIDGEVVSWEWSWDGGGASGPNPVVVLPPGETAVSLEILDDDGSGVISEIAVELGVPGIDDPDYIGEIAGAGLVGEDAAPEAVPFDDGVENILKYAFNMNLSGPDARRMERDGSAGLPTARLAEEGGETFLEVRYLRRIGTSLAYMPVKSATLEPGSFEPLTGAETAEDLGNGFERVTVMEPCDPGEEPSCFSMVRVETESPGK